MTATENLPARRDQRPAPLDITGQITTLRDALELADALSRSRLVPRSMQGNAPNIFHVIMTGQQLGLHWTQALRVIYSPGDGQIGLRGSFLLAKLREAGHSYSIDEGEDYCAFTITRGDTGESFTATFTDDDAVRAGLMKRQDGRLVALSRDGNPLPWMQWTPRMRRWRSVADGCGFFTPEIALGFEIEGIQAEEPQPEVMLRPETPAPPEPAASEAATGEDQAAQVKALEEQLRQAEERNRDRPPAVEEQALPPLDVTEDRTPAQLAEDGDTRGEPVPEPADRVSEANEPKVGKARIALERHLTERFIALGWPPDKYRDDVLRACSVFCRRTIKNIRGMQPGEMNRLADALEKLWNTTQPPARVVAMTDEVLAWARNWETADPTGYARYEAGE